MHRHPTTAINRPKSYANPHTCDCSPTHIINYNRARSGEDEREGPNEFGSVFVAFFHHLFRLSIKIEIRFAKALDDSA